MATNYRPVANIPFLGKVLERVVAGQLQALLDETDYLDPFQSGFRPGYSTESALVTLYDDLCREKDRGSTSLLVLLDLSAAFDTIDHGEAVAVLNRCLAELKKYFLAKNKALRRTKFHVLSLKRILLRALQKRKLISDLVSLRKLFWELWKEKMAGKKVLIIYAHQEPKSMNGSLKTIAVEELTKQGCSVTVSDLYEMQFEPRTTRKDIVGNLHNPEEFNYGVEAWEACKHGCLSEDLIEEQRKVKEADLVIFQVIIFLKTNLMRSSTCTIKMPDRTGTWHSAVAQPAWPTLWVGDFKRICAIPLLGNQPETFL
ncbi:Ribosyldihydronicotinamide dehydrogenase [quinone] [Varanus komodoensis]|nr:Ribosyldihydronicotinamide dehydrogenase [quinone] [Varanus komodoensis]